MMKHLKETRSMDRGATADLRDQVGSCTRRTNDQKARDRRLAFRYGPRLAKGSTPWSAAEQYALENNYFVGAALSDSVDPGRRPVDLPGMRELATYTWTNGSVTEPVLLEMPLTQELTPPFVALIEFLAVHNHDVLLFNRRGRVPVTAQSRKRMVDAVGSARVEIHVAELAEAAQHDLTTKVQTEGPGAFSIGYGAPRDTELARTVARDRREAGWTKRAVGQYLELYGFENSAGTLGRWPAYELDALLGDAS